MTGCEGDARETMTPMAQIFPGWGWTLKVEPQPIGPTSREQWRHTDSNGHEHHVDCEAIFPAYPTLDFVIDEEHWCEGDEQWCDRAGDPWTENNEDPPPHEPHMVADTGHFECKPRCVASSPRHPPSASCR